jgi:hypothetical protein
VRLAQWDATAARAGANRWRRAAALSRLARRLAVMRTLGADLAISRAQSALEAGYLRM